MNRFFQELRRRNVIRVAGLYAVVGWLLMQLAVVLETTLLLPTWFDTFITIVVLLGFPLADPVVGLAISAAILVLLWGTVHSVGARLMDRIDPDLVDRAEHALGHVGGITAVREVRLRWVGHRLQGDAVIEASDRSLAEAERLLAEADRELRAHLPNLEEMRVRAVPTAESSA